MESPPDPSKTSPLLPWEVIERVISHSYEPAIGTPQRYRWPITPESILNFSLTCRDLRPRSLCFLVANAILYTRDKAFDFCDFLEAKPHLQPFVRSISVDPENFAPIPLLQVHVLPNLSRVEFFDLKGRIDSQLSLNPSILTCSRLLSGRIQTLSISMLYFKSSLQCFQLLSAFPKILHLIWIYALIKEEDNTSALEVAKQRLSRRLRLRTVSVFSFMYCSD